MNFDRELVALRPRLLKYANKLTMNPDSAEDLLSATMVNALRYREKFVGGKLFAWLCTIMIHIHFSSRRRLRWDGGYVEDLVAMPSVAASQEAPIHLADAIDALSRLPRIQRDALTLRALGYEYEEIAEITDIPLGTVKSRIFRGRVALVEELA